MINLHTFTGKGSLASLISVDDIVRQSDHIVSMCDTNLFNVVNFYKRCIENDKVPIIGFEVNLAFGKVNQLLSKYGNISTRLSLFAHNEEGYKSLVKLSTKSWIEGLYKIPRIDFNMLKEHNEGLLCVIPSDFSFPSLYLNNNNVPQAVQDIRNLMQIFEDRLYYAMMANTRPTDIELQFIEESKLPCIASNYVWYKTPDDYNIWKYMIAISQNKLYESIDMPNSFYFRNEDEFEQCDWITNEMVGNIYEFVNRIEPYNLDSRELGFPDMKVNEIEFTHMLFKELENRNLDNTKYIERLGYELNTICSYGYIDYFMLVADIIRYTNDELSGYWSAGRGSVGGCLVAYLLGITRIDPVNPVGFDMQIPFDRFLNSGRKVMPDIDLDFLPKDREEVIDYLKGKYGDDACKNIMTTTTLGAKSALRDSCRITGNLTPNIESIIKSFPHDQHLTLSMIEDSDIYINNQNDLVFVRMFAVAKKLEGIPKSLGVHASGIAISKNNMSEYVPYFVHNGRIVTQYDQDQLDYLGIVKLDILGLNMLQIIADTCKMINPNDAFSILQNIDVNDTRIYKFLNDGLITGVFQWDTYNYKKVINDVKPSNFKELVDLNTLGRSAALLSGLTEKYINRKNGTEAIEPLHPRLKGLMNQTYELPLYQEQIMKIFMELAGFTYSEADDVRKAIGKKIPELMEKQKEKFIDGCMATSGMLNHEVDEIWSIIDKFSKYTWNLGHAMCYTQICYETAYLAYKYPGQFYCACANNAGNAEDAGEFISTLKKREIEIYNPDLRNMNKECIVLDGQVRLGLRGIKYISDKTIEKLESKFNGWITFDDFSKSVSKKDVNKTALLSLFCSGAFDEMFYTEHDIECFLDRSGLIEKEKIVELRRNQYERCGRVAYSLSKLFPDLDNIGNLIEKSVVKIPAYIVKYREIYTKNHQKMAFMVIEDDAGRHEVTWFPEFWKKIKIEKTKLFIFTLKYENGLIGINAKLPSDTKKEE